MRQITPVHFIKWCKHENLCDCSFIKNICNFGETPICRLRLYILQTRIVFIAHFLFSPKKGLHTTRFYFLCRATLIKQLVIVSKIQLLIKISEAAIHRCSLEKSFLEIFMKFTGEHSRVLSCNFAAYLQNTFS